MRIIRLLSLSILLAAFAQAGFAASPWHVNTNADDTDDNIGDGICHTAAGQCSLRAAIQESSFFDPSTNSIVFDAGVSTIILAGALPDLREPTTIDGTSLPGFIAGVNMVQLNGNASATAGLGLSFHAAGSVIKALVIRGCTSDGIDIAVNNVTVQQCFIGTDVTGTTDQGNGGDGIAVDSAGNVIGGTVPGPITLGGTGNVISGNAKHGIQIFSVSSLTNTVQNNFIGVNVTGTAALQNDLDGVLITGGATTTVIGDANVISGNGGNGILISGAPANTVGANHIGTDITGLVAIANGGDGVNISGVSSTGNVIGGPLLPQRNVISGNTEDGVQITGGANSNTVEGNFIGTNNPGTGAKGNGRYGILVSSDSNLIAGTVAGPQLISGNVSDGIHFVGANNNSVFTNQIGESIGGAFIPNGGAGIAVVSSGTANFVRQNNIGGNGGLGIDLSTTTSADGPNFPQDDMDPDTGPNDLQNFPVITSAISSGGVTTVTGTLNSVPNSAPFSFLIDLFYSDAADPTGFGEGQTYDKTISVNTDGLGNATFSTTLVANVPAGKFITATASNPSSSTSEFSQALVVTVPPSADLSTTKVDSPDPVTAGTNLTYTITVTNAGPSPATTASLSDTLPAGTTFVSLSSAAGWSCSTPAVGAGGTVSCSNPSFGLTSAIFTLTVAVAPSVTAGTIITNTATASSATADPNPGNESGTATTTVATSADLSTTKVDTPDPVTAGTNLTYTITVNNAGPSDAATASLSDTLPAGTTFVSFSSPGGWSCSTPAVGAGGTVSCSNPSLTAGSAIFTLTVKVAPSVTVGTVITNTATASSSTSDPNPGNESGTATTTVATSADLSVTKVDTPDPVTAGSNITYTIHVLNAGPSDAASVVLTDTTPVNTTFVSVTAPGYVCTAPAVGGTGTISCSSTSVVNGANNTITVVVNVNPGTPNATTITNTANVSSGTADSNAGNNSATATTTTAIVVLSADLGLTKIGAPDPVVAGTDLTYTINLSSAGPDPAANVALSDSIPANTTFVSLASPAGYTCITPAVGATAPPISCTNPSVASGASDTFTLVVHVGAGTPNGSTITNSATVTTTTSDPSAANNTATAGTGVTTNADLSVTKTDSPDPVAPGANITYTIHVLNAGPSDAASAVLTDTTPANTTFVSVTAPGYVCTAPAVGGTGTISCTSNVLNGANDTITVVVNVDPATPNATTITNTANVSSGTADSNAGNNAATATTTTAIVVLSADLGLTKIGAPNPVVAGTNLTYTIHLSSTGPDPAANVALTDSIPANTTFVSLASPAGYTCTTPAVGATAPPISCTNPSVASGASDTFTLVVLVGAATPNGTIITNVASVTTTTGDPNAANNNATATTTVSVPVGTADLALTKSDSPDPVSVGSTLTYSLTVRNNGPNDATGVILTDNLPASVTFVSASAGCANVALVVTCNVGTIINGATTTLTISVTPTAPGTITNNASVTANQADPNPANSSASASTTVTAAPPANIPAASPLVLLLLALTLSLVGWYFSRRS